MKNFMMILVLLMLFLLNVGCGKLDQTKETTQIEFSIETSVVVNKGMIEVHNAENMCGIEIDPNDNRKINYHLCVPAKSISFVSLESEWGANDGVIAQVSPRKIVITLTNGLDWDSYDGDVYLQATFIGGF